MISEDAAFTRLRPILAHILVLNEHEVHKESRLVDDLDADSMSFLEINHRLTRDFNLQVPRPKVSEEMLSKPLLEVLDQVEFATSDPGMLEFMTGEMLFAARQNPELRSLLLDQFRTNLAIPEFREKLRTAVEKSQDDPVTRKSIVLLIGAVSSTPELAPFLVNPFADDRAITDVWQKLVAESEIEQLSADAAVASLPAAWAGVFLEMPARRSLNQISIGQFAKLIGTTPPVGLKQDQPMSALALRDIFRFITVGFYVGYIVFLSRKQALEPALAKAENNLGPVESAALASPAGVT